MCIIVTTELRGEHYREHAWVDAHGWIWTWDKKTQRWKGRDPKHGMITTGATEDEVNNYLLFGGRGPFLKLAAG